MDPVTQAAPRATFLCTRCKHAYAWARELVGKTARCSCGQVMCVPAKPHAAPQGPMPTAQFAVGTAANPSFIPSSMATPSMGTLASALAVPVPAVAPGSAGVTRAIKSGENDEPLDPELEKELSAGGLVAKEGAEYVYNEFRDKQFPQYLLLAGFIVIVAQVAISIGGSVGAFAAAAIAMAILVAIRLALMLGGVLVAARFAGISFGPIGSALLKLSAICVGPTALGSLVADMLGGDIAVQCLGSGISLFLYYILISYLFCLDGGQTVTCVIAIFVVRLVAGIVIGLIGVGIVTHQVSNEVEHLGEQQAEQVVEMDVE